MSKQDRTPVRNVTGLEYKYNFEKTFAELHGLSEQTRKDLEEQEAIMEAELSLRIMYDDNDQIVSMLNASADIVKLTSNRLEIESDYFSLSADGRIVATAGELKTLTATECTFDYCTIDYCTINDTCTIKGVLTGNTISSVYDSDNYCYGHIEFNSGENGAFYDIGMRRDVFSAGMYIGAYEGTEPAITLYSEIASAHIGGNYGFRVDTVSSINLNASIGIYANGVEIATKTDINSLDERLKKLEGTA